jgi:hypothetical protein
LLISFLSLSGTRLAFLRTILFSEERMLRISRLPGPAPVTLKLEGKLMGPWVDALREACAGDPVRLDLSAVAFVDSEGLALLHELLTGQVTLAACSSLVAELLQRGSR